MTTHEENYRLKNALEIIRVGAFGRQYKDKWAAAVLKTVDEVLGRGDTHCHPNNCQCQCCLPSPLR
jgi:hypothetical protein